MGNPSMESARGSAKATLAIFVGIAVTRHSLARGLLFFKRWSSAMEAFSQVNIERALSNVPFLPRELLHIIEELIKHEAHGAVKNLGAGITDHHLELINKHFSLKIKTAGRSFRENDIFLCIPWDLNVKNPGVGSLCHSISAEAEGEIHAGYYDNVQEFSCGQAYFVDHDLRVTKNKVILINKAIRDMQLEVSSTQRARFTKSEVSSTTSDFKFKQEDNPNGGKLWWPRVIALQEVHLELQEGQEENNY